MKGHTIQVLVALSISIITLLAGSGTLAAHLLTDFYISSEVTEPGKNILTVENTGSVQANNAILQIEANGTIYNYVDKCAEGQIQELIDDKILVVKFSRMSPGIECNIDIVGSKPVILTSQLNFDDRLWPWPQQVPSSPQLLVIILVALLVFLIVFPIACALVITHLILNGIEPLRNLEVKIRHVEVKIHNTTFVLNKNKFEKSIIGEKTINFVQKEYDQKINEIDAKILELIYLKKNTMAQLQVYSGLYLGHVKFRVKKMRRYELVTEERIDLHEELHDHFKRDLPRDSIVSKHDDATNDHTPNASDDNGTT